MCASQIDIGIVNYNGGDALLACVRSAHAQTECHPTIYVYDNASSDESVSLLESSGIPCTILRSTKNLGYAAACNALLAQFTAPVAALANMDLVFRADWALHVLGHLKAHPDTGAVATLVLHADETSVNATGVRFFGDLYPMNEGSGVPLADVNLEEREVFGCYGAVMTFRTELARQVGKFSEEFFLFYEETEWFWRWRLLGLRTVFVPSAVVVHQRSMVTVRYSLLKLYYPERNRVRSLVRLAPLWWFPIAMALSVFRFALQSRKGVPSQDASGKKQSKGIIILTILRAWKDGILCFREDLRIRRRYYSNAVKSPRGILDDCKTYALTCKDLS